MRNLIEYILFFRADAQFRSLVAFMDTDDTLPLTEVSPEATLSFLSEQARYWHYQPHVAVLYRRYKNNQIVVRS